MKQLTLSFESGLSKKHRSLLDCISTGIYRKGLTNVSGVVDMAPSNLSTALGGGDRKFGADEIEAYLDEYKDFDLIYYLLDKYLKDTVDTDAKVVLNDAKQALLGLQDVINRLEDSSRG